LSSVRRLAVAGAPSAGPTRRTETTRAAITHFLHLLFLVVREDLSEPAVHVLLKFFDLLFLLGS
jgi:hypothetical protein